MDISRIKFSVSEWQLALIGGACITGISNFPFACLLLLFTTLYVNDCYDDVECAAKDGVVMTIYLIYGILLLGIFMGTSYWIYRKGRASSESKPKENFMEGS